MDLDLKDSPATNAHQSISQTNSIRANDEVRYDTSELSEVEEPAALETSSSTSDSPRTQQSEFGQQEHDISESESEHQGGSEDGEYDLDDAPPTNVAAHQTSSSPDSPRPAKRKLELDDDQQYMLKNPELYGLRRSVCARRLASPTNLLTW